MKPIEIRSKPVAGRAQPLVCTPLFGRTRRALLDELAAVMPKKPDRIELCAVLAQVRRAVAGS